MVILPGLVNTHHHFYQTLTRNLPAAQDADLFNWLTTHYPIWAGLTPEAIYVSSKVAIAELMLSGCTTSSDHTYIWPNGSRIDDQVRAAAETDRSMTKLSTGFALLAVLLATVGLYGVLSYTVAQRRREIGVRMALGADRARITRLILGYVSRVTAFGVILGCGAALGLGRLAQSMLFGVERPDPIVMIAAAVGVSVAAFTAATVPARRASRVDPITALRAE
jgi:predicted lysophospholipase L1 biosynthesis ABC-type transport system permease subunit